MKRILKFVVQLWYHEILKPFVGEMVSAVWFMFGAKLIIVYSNWGYVVMESGTYTMLITVLQLTVAHTRSIMLWQ